MLKRHWLPLAAIVGVAIVSLIIWVGSKTEPECADILTELSANSSPEQQNGAADSNSVTCQSNCQVTFFRTPKPEHEAEANTKGSNTACDTTQELDLLAQKRMAHWTFFIALLTGVGVLLLIGTLAEAQYTNQAFTQASQRELRAYVSVIEVIVIDLVAGKKPRLVLEYGNQGQTPAYGLGIVNGFNVRKPNAPWEEIDFENNVISRTVVGPNVRYTSSVTFEMPINQATVNRFLQGQAEIRCIGRIEYNDAFGRKRFTSFKFFMDPNKIGDGNRVPLDACKDGNDAD